MVDEVGPQQGVASCPASQVFGTWGEGGLAFFGGGRLSFQDTPKVHRWPRCRVGLDDNI